MFAVIFAVLFSTPSVQKNLKSMDFKSAKQENAQFDNCSLNKETNKYKCQAN